jgi:hypothetical protein
MRSSNILAAILAVATSAVASPLTTTTTASTGTSANTHDIPRGLLAPRDRTCDFNKPATTSTLFQILISISDEVTHQYDFKDDLPCNLTALALDWRGQPNIDQMNVRLKALYAATGAVQHALGDISSFLIEMFPDLTSEATALAS